jgi:hypothetical protein
MLLQLHCQFRGIYPSYLVLFSSGVGMWLAQYLFHDGKLAVTTAWALGALYAGKLGLIIYPSLSTLIATMCTVFAVSPIYVGVLYLGSSADAQVLKGPGAQGLQGLGRAAQLPFGLSSAHLALVSLLTSALAMGLSRHTLLGIVVRYTINSNPSEAFIIGCVMALWPLANLGIVTHHLPGSELLRRILAICLSLGLTLMAVEPDMAGVWGAKQGRGGGGSDGSGPWWAGWCLLGCVCCALSLCAAVVRRQGLLRTLASGGAGVCVCVCMCVCVCARAYVCGVCVWVCVGVGVGGCGCV